MESGVLVGYYYWYPYVRTVNISDESNVMNMNDDPAAKFGFMKKYHEDHNNLDLGIFSIRHSKFFYMATNFCHISH